MSSQPVRTVTVVGRDAPAWIAAASIQRALGAAGVTVHVIALPTALAGVEVYAATPSLHSLHHLLGIDEETVLNAVDSAVMVGQRFRYWNGGNSAFLQGFNVDQAGGQPGFLQIWAKARLSGLRVPFEEFSFGAMAAREGRVPSAGPGSAQLAGYGYHLDARSYSALLRKICVRRGINVIECPAPPRVEVAGNAVAAIHLSSGETVNSDLFVDASGPAALLLSQLDGGDFTSWSDHLPCDALLSASAPALEPLPAFSQISAFKAGWIGLFPTQGRTPVLAAYSTRTMDAEEVLERAIAISGLALAGDAVVSPLKTGARKRPWIGNCVAIGEAAATLEPLDAAPFHFDQTCIANVIDLFPVIGSTFLEAEQYNHRILGYAGNLRDYQAAHYRLNTRFDEPFWDRMRASPVGERLDHKIGLFEARGQVPLDDYDSFDEQRWSTMFVGHGLIPKGYDPRVDTMSEANQVEMIQARLRALAAQIPGLPTVESHLASARFVRELR